MVSVLTTTTTTTTEELSLPGLIILVALGSTLVTLGRVISRSTTFFALLVRHAETQRRLHGLPSAPPANYDRDRRWIARGLSGTGTITLLVAILLLAQSLARP